MHDSIQKKQQKQTSKKNQQTDILLTLDVTVG